MQKRKIIRLKKIDSTQDYAKKIAGKSPSGTIVIAEEQSEGRGQFERTWSSQKGGLYFSIILKPKIDTKCHPSKIPALTMKMASAIIDAIKIEKPKIFIKTPNDIMVKCKTGHKKIAGILTESSITKNKIDWIVVGVGVNINNKIPEELKNIAVSLKEITKKNWNIKKIFKEIVKKFTSKYWVDFSRKF